MYPVTRSNCLRLISEPIWVDGSKGSPTRTLASSAATPSTTWSSTGRCTSSLVPAAHTCPLPW
jgi:hypothetical protein